MVEAIAEVRYDLRSALCQAITAALIVMFCFESSLWSQIEEHSLGLSSEKTSRSLSIERMSVA